MTKYKKKLGNWGEELAKEYLRGGQYRLIAAPFRCKLGEIDIIAKEGDIIVFVEVRTRKGSRFGSPLESITQSKQRQMIRVANFYIHFITTEQFKYCRFDVLGIIQKPDLTEPQIIHVKDAFRNDSGV